MFFRLFSSLKMLSWLNLLMPVMKRKRRYCPNLLRGAEELPHLVAELLLQGGVGIAVQQGGIVLVNQHDNLLADLLGSSQNDALQKLGSGLFRFILSINIFTPVQEEIKLPSKVGSQPSETVFLSLEVGFERRHERLLPKRRGRLRK